ncbi:hypothetical protein TIFTF001_052446, partial [Ficus carica]
MTLPATGCCHVVAVPYPGRGHVNPMINICRQIASRKPDNLLITFVVTEEWLGLIGPDPTTAPDNLRFATIPNVVPSVHDRAKDIIAFVKAVWTKMEAPFEELLDRLEVPVSAIVADNNLFWAFDFANRRNIPVASLWTMSASVFSVFYHFDLLKQNGHYPVDDLSEKGHEVVDYIPGIPTTRLADLPGELLRTDNSNEKIKQKLLETTWRVYKAQAQYLLSTSVYELESQVIDVLKAQFPFPVYTIGPSIPYSQLDQTCNASQSNNVPDYLKWLDSQPKESVLYVSFGSSLSVASAQLDEIVAGLKISGTRYLQVVRGDASKIVEEYGNCEELGFVVPWCDQLRVLSHASIGGFWTHCGWNSTLEAVFCGVPILTFPIAWDQVSNSKQIVEDWKIGYKVKKGIGGDNLVTKDEIAEL